MQDNNCSLVERQRDLMTLIGGTLIMIQSCECLIKDALKISVPNFETMSFDEIHALDKKYKRTMLGGLINDIRKHVDVAADWDDFLSDFLDNRNDFIHEPKRVKGWNIKTIDGLNIANQFVQSLLGQSVVVLTVFKEFLIASGGYDELDFPDPCPIEYLKVLECKVRAEIDQFLKRK